MPAITMYTVQADELKCIHHASQCQYWVRIDLYEALLETWGFFVLVFIYFATNFISSWIQMIVDTPRAVDMETMFESHPTHPLTVWGRSPRKLPSDNRFYLYLPLILHYLIPLFPFCLYCYACNNAATFPGQPVGSFSILTNLLTTKKSVKVQNAKPLRSFCSTWRAKFYEDINELR